MIRSLMLVPLLLLGGCDFFHKVGETFEGLTNPLVGVGMLLAVVPSDNSVDLEGSDFEPGTGMTVFLADAANADELDQAPVVGAEVSMDGVEADTTGDGLYSIGPQAGLEYADNDTWMLEVMIGDGLATAAIDLPESANFNAPTQHTVGDDLVVDITGQGFDSLLIVVIESTTGDVTFSNEPQTAREFYDFTHRSSGELVVTIPGDEAFPSNNVYWVGVSGMIHTGASDLDEMNTALSTLMSGKMVVYPVATSP